MLEAWNLNDEASSLNREAWNSDREPLNLDNEALDSDLGFRVIGKEKRPNTAIWSLK
jgi:hypothetical protein